MSFTIQLHPEVVVDLKESHQWYERRSEGLGDRFISSVNKRLNEIAKTPERYAKKQGSYREVMIAFFPYLIVYEVFKKEQIIFVSYILHAKRDPTIKYKR